MLSSSIVSCSRSTPDMPSPTSAASGSILASSSSISSSSFSSITSVSGGSNRPRSCSWLSPDSSNDSKTALESALNAILSSFILSISALKDCLSSASRSLSSFIASKSVINSSLSLVMSSSERSLGRAPILSSLLLLQERSCVFLVLASLNTLWQRLQVRYSKSSDISLDLGSVFTSLTSVIYTPSHKGLQFPLQFRHPCSLNLIGDYFSAPVLYMLVDDLVQKCPPLFVVHVCWSSAELV